MHIHCSVQNVQRNDLKACQQLKSIFIYLKSTTEGPEGHLYCRKNTETHKKTIKQTNKRYNTENTTNQHTVYSATEKYEN